MGAKRAYTIKQLADLAGVSTRALRYYDQIGLLVPRRSENGYRAYDEQDVHALQHIMVLRACRVPLSTIMEVLADPGFELGPMLASHLADLRRQKAELEETIVAVQRVQDGLEAFESMDDRQRFEQLKQESVERFEEEYGAEARERYGDEAIDAANERMRGMSQMAWDAKEELEQRIKEGLMRAMATGDARSEEARYVAQMHAQWIRVHWGEEAYTPGAHRALAESYEEDPRFVEYYDGSCGAGATRFLRDAILANIG